MALIAPELDTTPVTLTLTKAEALVLFDRIGTRIDVDEAFDPADPFDQALAGLLAVLEAELTEPARADYPELVREAEKRLIPSRSRP